MEAIKTFDKIEQYVNDTYFNKKVSYVQLINKSLIGDCCTCIIKVVYKNGKEKNFINNIKYNDVDVYYRHIKLEKIKKQIQKNKIKTFFKNIIQL